MSSSLVGCLLAVQDFTSTELSVKVGEPVWLIATPSGSPLTRNNLLLACGRTSVSALPASTVSVAVMAPLCALVKAVESSQLETCSVAAGDLLVVTDKLSPAVLRGHPPVPGAREGTMLARLVTSFDAAPFVALLDSPAEPPLVPAGPPPTALSARAKAFVATRKTSDAPPATPTTPPPAAPATVVADSSPADSSLSPTLGRTGPPPRPPPRAPERLAPSQLSQSSTSVASAADKRRSVFLLPASSGQTESDFKHNMIANELLMTESSFVSDLELMLAEFLEPLGAQSFAADTVLPRLSTIVSQLLPLHKTLLFGLEQAMRGYPALSLARPLKGVSGGVFLDLYKQYCTMYVDAHDQLKALAKKHAKFRKIVDDPGRAKRCRNLRIEDFLIKPVQRLCKYPLLVKELIKCSSDAGELEQLQTAYKKLCDAVDSVNEHKRSQEGDTFLASYTDAMTLLRKAPPQVDEALSVLVVLAAQRPTDCSTQYAIACALSLKGDIDGALLHSGRALQYGYANIMNMAQDESLIAARAHPDWPKIFVQKLDAYGVDESSDAYVDAMRQLASQKRTGESRKDSSLLQRLRNMKSSLVDDGGDSRSDSDSDGSTGSDSGDNDDSDSSDSSASDADAKKAPTTAAATPASGAAGGAPASKVATMAAAAAMPTLNRTAAMSYRERQRLSTGGQDLAVALSLELRSSTPPVKMPSEFRSELERKLALPQTQRRLPQLPPRTPGRGGSHLPTAGRAAGRLPLPTRSGSMAQLTSSASPAPVPAPAGAAAPAASVVAAVLPPAARLSIASPVAARSPDVLARRPLPTPVPRTSPLAAVGSAVKSPSEETAAPVVDTTATVVDHDAPAPAPVLALSALARAAQAIESQRPQPVAGVARSSPPRVLNAEATVRSSPPRVPNAETTVAAAATAVAPAAPASKPESPRNAALAVPAAGSKPESPRNDAPEPVRAASDVGVGLGVGVGVEPVRAASDVGGTDVAPLPLTPSPAALALARSPRRHTMQTEPVGASDASAAQVADDEAKEERRRHRRERRKHLRSSLNVQSSESAPPIPVPEEPVAPSIPPLPFALPEGVKPAPPSGSPPTASGDVDAAYEQQVAKVRAASAEKSRRDKSMMSIVKTVDRLRRERVGRLVDLVRAETSCADRPKTKDELQKITLLALEISELTSTVERLRDKLPPHLASLVPNLELDDIASSSEDENPRGADETGRRTRRKEGGSSRHHRKRHHRKQKAAVADAAAPARSTPPLSASPAPRPMSPPPPNVPRPMSPPIEGRPPPPSVPRPTAAATLHSSTGSNSASTSREHSGRSHRSHRSQRAGTAASSTSTPSAVASTSGSSPAPLTVNAASLAATAAAAAAIASQPLTPVAATATATATAVVDDDSSTEEIDTAAIPDAKTEVLHSDAEDEKDDDDDDDESESDDDFASGDEAPIQISQTAKAMLRSGAPAKETPK